LPEASPTERARAAAQKAVVEAQATGTVAPVLKLGPTHATRRESAAAVRAERGRFIAAARRSLAADAEDPDTALPPEAGSRAASLFRFHTRRAAPAAAAEAADGVAEEFTESDGSGAGIRRPVLIALAATVVLLCSWQAARSIFDRAPVVAATQAPKPVATAALPASVAAPVRKVETTEQVASLAPTSDGWTAAATAPKEASFAQPAGGLDSGSVAAELATVAAEPAAHDPVITGSIPTPLAPPRVAATIPTEVTGRLRQRAGSGDAAAQYEIGARLADGRKLGRDPAKAESWFQLAASQGLAPAQYRLGSLYEKGNGVTKNLGTAEGWYLKAADAGNIRSMHNLGVLYAEGGLGKPDYEKAALWFRKAADHGVRDSQYNLGILYARGLGVRQNLPEAFLWLSLAATQGDADAGAKRDQVASKMSSQALVTAKLAVGTFKPKPVSPEANDVAAPPGGWDGAVTAAAQSDKRGAAKPKH
jgi:localization factor PodJL